MITDLLGRKTTTGETIVLIFVEPGKPSIQGNPVIGQSDIPLTFPEVYFVTEDDTGSLNQIVGPWNLKLAPEVSELTIGHEPAEG